MKSKLVLVIMGFMTYAHFFCTSFDSVVLSYEIFSRTEGTNLYTTLASPRLKVKLGDETGKSKIQIGDEKNGITLDILAKNGPNEVVKLSQSVKIKDGQHISQWQNELALKVNTVVAVASQDSRYICRLQIRELQ